MSHNNPLCGFGRDAGFLEEVHAVTMFAVELLECEGLALVQNSVKVSHAGFRGKCILQWDMGPKR